MGNYVPLMEELYDDFKNDNGLAMIIKKNLITFLCIIFSYILIYIISLFTPSEIRNTINAILIFLLVLFILGEFVYIIHISSKEKQEKVEKKKMFLLFRKLLNKEKYQLFDNIAMLTELENYYQIKIVLFNNNDIGTVYGFAKNASAIFIPIFIANLLQFIINQDNFVMLVVVSILTAFLVFTVSIIWIIREINLNDDTSYLNLLLIIIKERKIQIIESRNDNIFNKIKYSLKLGEYS